MGGCADAVESVGQRDIERNPCTTKMFWGKGRSRGDANFLGMRGWRATEEGSKKERSKEASLHTEARAAGAVWSEMVSNAGFVIYEQRVSGWSAWRIQAVGRKQGKARTSSECRGGDGAKEAREWALCLQERSAPRWDCKEMDGDGT